MEVIQSIEVDEVYQNNATLIRPQVSQISPALLETAEAQIERLLGSAARRRPFAPARGCGNGNGNGNGNNNRTANADPHLSDDGNSTDSGGDGMIELTVQVDLTYYYENRDVEMPDEDDLKCMWPGYRFRHYPQTDPDILLADAPKKTAPPPSIPDPSDDEPLMGMITRRVPVPRKRKRNRANRPQRQPKRLRNQQRNVQLSEELIEVPPLPSPPPLPELLPELLAEQLLPPPAVYKPNGLTDLPALARDEIYRHLLLAASPIRVHGSWELVFRNQNLNLLSRVLCLSKQIHQEAARILYGENTFLYLLRDGPSLVTNVLQIAHDDSLDPANDAEESESDWGTNNAPPRSRRRRRHGRRPAEKQDINVQAYKSYFRLIAIEAEHNRFLQETKDRLAKAIRVFAVPDDAESQPEQSIWLRSLTIRVAPMWERQLGHRGSFTFVDFFDKDSDIMAAIRSVPSASLVVKLLTWDSSSQVRTGRVSRSQASAAAAATQLKKGVSIMLDMRPYHRYNQNGEVAEGDTWENDAAMQWERKRKHGVLVERLAGLQSLIVKCCRDERYGERGVPRRVEENDDDDGDGDDSDVDGFIELAEVDDAEDGDYLGE
jgi:hypothetical protein